MIFPSLKLETTVQVGDKLRFDAKNCFTTNGETITSIEIKPSVSDTYFDVFVLNRPEKWFLDWAYDSDGVVSVEVKVTTDADTKSRTYQVDVLDEATDALFSNDSDLFPLEPNLYNYLPQGKNSFLYAHRAAQYKILAYLDEQRIWKNDGTRFDKFDIVDKEEFKHWSMMQTLLVIFESTQSRSGDLFQQKREEYERDMKAARNRASLRLDTDSSGENDPTPYNIRTTTLVRR